MSGLRVVLAEIRNVGHLLHLESYLSSRPQLSTEDKFSRFLYQLKKKLFLWNLVHPGFHPPSRSLQMVTYFTRVMAQITRAVRIDIYPSTLQGAQLQRYV